MIPILLVSILCASAAYAQFSEILFDIEGSDYVDYYLLADLGDQNNDGFDDIGVIQVGPPSERSGARIYYGGTSMNEIPDVEILSPDSIYYLINGGAAGDLNGDGYTDLFLVLCLSPITQEFLYAVFPGGPSLGDEPIVVLRVAWNSNMRSLGDFNGDGYDDLCIFFGYEDRIEIYFGGNVTDTIPDWQYSSPVGFPNLARPQGIGDINGDGFSDFNSDTYNIMITRFFLGNAEPDTLPGLQWINFEARGSSIVNDITGDGIDDLLVPYGGALDIHPGGPNLSRIAQYHLETVHGSNENIRINSGGDLNGDGIGDLLVTGYESRDLEIFLGSRWLGIHSAQVIRTASNNLEFWPCTSAGDVNSDGADDILTGIGDRNIRVYAGNPNVIVPAIENRVTVADEFSLQAYPNPFNPLTTISVSMPRLSPVTVELFDVLGRKVETLHSGMLPQGVNSLQINGNHLASGNYLVVMRSMDSQVSKRITLVR